jgi:hypothetical protein
VKQGITLLRLPRRKIATAICTFVDTPRLFCLATARCCYNAGLLNAG